MIAFGPDAIVFDVTAPLAPGMAVWPGDASFELAPSARIASGASCNVSRLACSSHTGTHVDAPWHFIEEGAQLDDIPLERWIGPCHVIDIAGETGPISADALERARIPSGTDRVLLRTRREAAPIASAFDTAYAALSKDAAEWLIDRNVILLGIDSPSVEPFDDDGHGVHHALLGAGMLIVEGLDLSSIAPGPYFLICLPLRLMEADGSPARVLLVRDSP